MLRPPYDHYERLYMYHLDCGELPPINDPDLIGAWNEDDAAVLFFHRPKEKLIDNICRQTDSSIIYQADLDYQDWEAGQHVTTFSVGGLTVAPIWEPGEADIRLDPSVIFGSGFHQSTRLCLETMLDYLDKPERKINSMLDLGCGTGLLSIAAAKQGVSKAVGIDHNSLACHLARANGARNGVSEQLEIRQMDLKAGPPPTRGADLVVANLYRELHLSLFSRPDYWKGSLYILAGFIEPMERELFAALPEKGIRFVERRSKDRWGLWVLEKSEEKGERK